MVLYPTRFLANVLLAGVWSRAVAKWTGLRFSAADLVITGCLCGGLALLPGYGWRLATVVLLLILRGVERAEPGPEIVVMAGGCALVWLATFVTGMSPTSRPRRHPDIARAPAGAITPRRGRLAWPLQKPRTRSGSEPLRAPSAPASGREPSA